MAFSRTKWHLLGHLLGLSAIALLTAHALSTLFFAVIGLAPSSPNWPLAVLFASFLSLSGATVGLKNVKSIHRISQPITILGSFSAGAILGLFTLGQLSDQDTTWAAVGLVVGGIGFGAIAKWAHSRQETMGKLFWKRAIALIQGLCAYTLASGFGIWTWAALTASRPLLAILTGLIALLYLWFTRRAITVLQRSRLNSRIT